MATESIPPLKKTCTKCGRELPATEVYFHRKKDGKYGLRADCRDCVHTRLSTYHAEHREEILAKRAVFYAEHREDKTSAHRTYYAEHREEIRAIQSSYYVNHREEILARRAVYRVKHKEDIAAYYVTPHGKELRRIYSHNRRARKRASGDTLTQADIELQIKAQTDKQGRLHCWWCGRVIAKGETYHIDHWIPLARGGSNGAGNIRIAHSKCNQKKHTKLPSELGRLI